jgi:hypothetical protein
MLNGTNWLMPHYGILIGDPMTDYRLRNHDLLYASRPSRPLAARNVAVFGAILLTVTIAVVGHLTDRFGTAAGVSASPAPSVTAQDTVAPRPVLQLVTPGTSRSGS